MRHLPIFNIVYSQQAKPIHLYACSTPLAIVGLSESATQFYFACLEARLDCVLKAGSYSKGLKCFVSLGWNLKGTGDTGNALLLTHTYVTYVSQDASCLVKHGERCWICSSLGLFTLRCLIQTLMEWRDPMHLLINVKHLGAGRNPYRALQSNSYTHTNTRTWAPTPKALCCVTDEKQGEPPSHVHFFFEKADFSAGPEVSHLLSCSPSLLRPGM